VHNPDNPRQPESDLTQLIHLAQAGDRDAADALYASACADLRRMRTQTEIGLALLDLGNRAAAIESLDRALALSRQLQVPSAPDRTDIEAALLRATQQ
jgi:hypothetical protein